MLTFKVDSTFIMLVILWVKSGHPLTITVAGTGIGLIILVLGCLVLCYSNSSC